MKKEVRGLQCGEYWSEDDSLLLKISKNDNGVLIEIADFDADTFYAVEVDEKANADFEIGQISPLPNQDKGKKDAAD